MRTGFIQQRERQILLTQAGGKNRDGSMIMVAVGMKNGRPHKNKMLGYNEGINVKCGIKIGRMG